MEKKERPLVTYFKKAERTQNKIILPKFWVENNGRDYVMEVYKGKLVIIPIKEKEEDKL